MFEIFTKKKVSENTSIETQEQRKEKFIFRQDMRENHALNNLKKYCLYFNLPTYQKPKVY